ncbi:MAG TPA: glycosyltransferase family 1 protein, partial [Candidatus Binatia bacterium]|nr:glycosyltransferase family 1 protein [Candidatus Binatia bacterium]
MESKLRIIVTGLIAQYPLGGVTWDYFQYVLGLAQLGHEVYYLEDTGQWPYNPQEGGLGKDCDFNVQYLSAVMSRYGLGEQWAYRFPWQSQWFGLADAKRQEVIRSADLLINVSGTLEQPEEYRHINRLAYVDSDPVFTQVKLARGQLDFRKWIDVHDVQFSFGECLSTDVPETGHHWRPTRQPIVLSQWHPERPFREVFTTVMNWTSYKPVVYGDQSYGQKDLEFARFQELPRLIAPTALEIAVNAGKTRRTPRHLLARKGWRVVDPAEVCPDLESYRDYIES